jgi:hypothetical protein
MGRGRRSGRATGACGGWGCARGRRRACSRTWVSGWGCICGLAIVVWHSSVSVRGTAVANVFLFLAHFLVNHACCGVNPRPRPERSPLARVLAVTRLGGGSGREHSGKGLQAELADPWGCLRQLPSPSAPRHTHTHTTTTTTNKNCPAATSTHSHFLAPGIPASLPALLEPPAAPWTP